MWFSKTLHWNGGGAVESLVSNHENTRNGIGESRAMSLLSPVESSSGRQFEWGCLEKTYLHVIVSKIESRDKFTCGMGL